MEMGAKTKCGNKNGGGEEEVGLEIVQGGD